MFNSTCFQVSLGICFTSSYLLYKSNSKYKALRSELDKLIYDHSEQIKKP